MTRADYRALWSGENGDGHGVWSSAPERSPCVHLGRIALWPEKPDVFRDWRSCDRGHGIVCACQQCKTCPDYAAETETPTPTPTEPTMSAELDEIRWPVRFDESNLAPGQPGRRFNSSIIDWKGEFLLAYRDGWAGSEIHLIRLDRSFRPKGASVKLDLMHWRDANYGREDPRLFTFRGKLHVAYIGVVGGDQIHHTNVLYARISDGLAVEQVFSPQYPGRNTWEKNWSFFEYDSTLYCSYTIAPHRVLRIDGDRATLVYTTQTASRWSGGEPRGGASPVRIGDVFYEFFHASTEQYGHRVYQVGLLTFEAKPPFRVTSIVPDPILWAHQESRPPDQYASVIFPCGAVLYDGHWVVSCGIHDRWTSLEIFCKAHLDDRLVSSGRAGAAPGHFGASFVRHGSDKDTDHSYGELYDAVVPPAWRDSAVNILEIGVYNGASMRAWTEAMPSARITGWDVSDAPRDVPAGATFSRLDGTRLDSAARIADGSLSLVVDDGSHIPADQSASLKNLYRKLAPSGVYVVEDIRPEAVVAAIVSDSCLPTGANWVEIDLRPVRGRWDDRVLVVSPSPLSEAVVALTRPPVVAMPRVVYHVASMWVRWKSIVVEQFALAAASGLGGEWTVTLNGTAADAVELGAMARDCGIRIDIVDRGEHPNRFESPAMRQVWRLAGEGAGPILYWHTKAVSRPPGDRDDWRKLMGVAVVGSWQWRVKELEAWSVVGVNWCVQYQCYPGNFWMVRGDAVRNLTPFDEFRRAYQRSSNGGLHRRNGCRESSEKWIGSGTLRYGSVVCTGADDDSEHFRSMCHVGSVWHDDIARRWPRSSPGGG